MRWMRGSLTLVLTAGSAICAFAATAPGGLPSAARSAIAVPQRHAAADTSDSSVTTTAAPAPGTDTTAAVSAGDTAGVVVQSSAVPAPAPAPDTVPGNAPGRPAWLPPDSAELARVRPPGPSVSDGIQLTATQAAAMEAARAQYRPQIDALVAQWQAAQQGAAAVDTLALRDSLARILSAQRTAVLAVLTSTQRAQYNLNVQRQQFSSPSALPDTSGALSGGSGGGGPNPDGDVLLATGRPGAPAHAFPRAKMFFSTCTSTNESLYPCTIADTVTFGKTDSTTFTIKNRQYGDVVVTPSVSCPNPWSGYGGMATPLIASCQSSVTAATVIHASDSLIVRVRYTLNTPSSTGFPWLSTDSTQVATFNVWNSVSNYLEVASDIRVNGQWYRVDFPPGNDSRDLRLCTAACFSAHYEQPTMGYRSLNVARGVTLVYSGETVRPRPFVYADVTTTRAFPSTGPLILSLQVNGVNTSFRNGDARSFFTAIPAPTAPDTIRHVRIGGQVDASSYTTGVYPTLLTVKDTSRTQTDPFQYFAPNSGALSIPGALVVINGQDSPIARGWGIKGIQRLYKKTISNMTEYLVVDGDGSFTHFSGDINYGWPTAGSSDLSRISVGKRYYQDGSVVAFDTAGYMKSYTDGKTGMVTTYTFEAWAGGERLKQIVDPYWKINGVPAAITFNYGANGLTSIVEPGPTGRTTTITVDATKHLTAITDPDAVSTTFTYNAQDQLSTVRDRLGAVAQTYFYNTQTYLADSVRGPSVPVDQGNGTTAPGSPVVHYTPWQGLGVPVSPTSATSPAAWADTTRTAAVVGPMSETTSYVMDPWGQPTKVTDPLGQVTRSTRVQRPNYYYDRYFNYRVRQVLSPLADSVLHPDSTRDLYGYNFDWMVLRLLWESHPGQSTVNYAYNYVNKTTTGYPPLVDSTWGFGTRMIQYYYYLYGKNIRHGLPDSARSPTTVTSSPGATPTTVQQWEYYTYDTVTFRPTAVRDVNGQTTTYVYDPVFGNLAQTGRPGGRNALTLFDSHGRDSVVRVPQLADVVTLYDGLDRVTTRTVQATPALTTTYQYNALYPTTVTDGKGQQYVVERDSLGRATKEYAANSTTASRTYRYDLGSRLTSVTNRRGQRVQLTYDVVGRLVSRSGVTSVPDSLRYSLVQLGVGLVGKGTQVVAWNGVARDTVRGDQAQVARTGVRSVTRFKTDSTKPFTLTQSALDLWTGQDSLVVTSGTPDVYPVIARDKVPYVAGDLGLLLDGTGLTDPYFDSKQRLIGTFGVGMGYEWVGHYTTTDRRVDVSYSAGVDSVFHRAYAYDSLNRVSVSQEAVGSGQTRQRRVRYDGAGRVDSVVYRHPCTTWPGTVDPNSGWDVACGAVDSTPVYTYDAAGNRTDRASAYDAGNQQRVFGRLHYTYDADGNVSQKVDTVTGQTWRYTWDALNRLSAVKRVGGDSVTYEYDALGRLARRKVNGGVDRHWLYVGQHILAELDGSLRRRVEYTYWAGTDRPQASLTASGTGYVVERYALDELGNVLGQTRSGMDSVLERVTYDAWGKPTFVGAVRTGNKLLWKGLMWEDTAGLYYVRNRWYDPDVGRFLSEDPIGLKGGINMYTFGNNDPINTADPSGNLYVYVWDTDLTGGSGGHASIMLEDGKTYISWWPAVNNFLKAASWGNPLAGLGGVFQGDVPADLSRTLEGDAAQEGRRPDHQIHLLGLDEEKIRNWWNDFKGTHYYNVLWQNCAETVIDALRAGGAPIQGRFHYPTEIIPALDNLLSIDPSYPFAPRGGGGTW